MLNLSTLLLSTFKLAPFIFEKKSGEVNKLLSFPLLFSLLDKESWKENNELDCCADGDVKVGLPKVGLNWVFANEFTRRGWLELFAEGKLTD